MADRSFDMDAVAVGELDVDDGDLESMVDAGKAWRSAVRFDGSDPRLQVAADAVGREEFIVAIRRERNSQDSVL